tara:strand:- start:1319 stop:1897 length:579 start_codon:yes stop_codon:yes gene_type:complete
MKTFKEFVVNNPIRIIMLGGPGSGKSTYSKYITKHFGIPHLYTGDMMRALSKKDTPEGRKVKAALDSGKYVDTKIVMNAVIDRLKNPDTMRGYVFDGFPRNMEQVRAMEENEIRADHIVNLNVSEDEVIKRLTARGRADDKPNIIRQRLATHEKETGPVIKHYEDKLINIKAEDKTPEEIAGDIIKKVESRS